MRQGLAAVLMAVLAVLAPGAAGAGPILPMPEDVRLLVEEGLSNNRQIQAMRAGIRGMEKDAVAAGALADPVIGVEIMSLPWESLSFHEEPMTQKQVFVEQMLPWFGKRGLMRRMAGLSAKRQKALLQVRENELARMIAEAWFDLGYANESLDVNRRLSEILDQMARVAETRYASGRGLQQDVLQAQVEQGEALEERIRLEQEIHTFTRKLNELLNRPAYQPVTPPANLPPPPEMKPIEADLTAAALRNNPMILEALVAIEEARAGVELAQKEYSPDMTARLAYGQRDDDLSGVDQPDLISASLMFNVPLWKKDRQDPQLAAARDRLAEAELSLENLTAALPHQVSALVKETYNTLENRRLYEEALMVQASQWAESALSAYGTGKAEFGDVLSARIRLIRFTRMAAERKAMAWKKVAELAELTGALAPEVENPQAGAKATPAAAPEGSLP